MTRGNLVMYTVSLLWPSSTMVSMCIAMKKHVRKSVALHGHIYIHIIQYTIHKNKKIGYSIKLLTILFNPSERFSA